MIEIPCVCRYVGRQRQDMALLLFHGHAMVFKDVTGKVSMHPIHKFTWPESNNNFLIQIVVVRYLPQFFSVFILHSDVSLLYARKQFILQEKVKIIADLVKCPFIIYRIFRPFSLRPFVIPEVPKFVIF